MFFRVFLYISYHPGKHLSYIKNRTSTSSNDTNSLLLLLFFFCISMTVFDYHISIKYFDVIFSFDLLYFVIIFRFLFIVFCVPFFLPFFFLLLTCIYYYINPRSRDLRSINMTYFFFYFKLIIIYSKYIIVLNIFIIFNNILNIYIDSWYIYVILNKFTPFSPEYHIMLSLISSHLYSMYFLFIFLLYL